MDSHKRMGTQSVGNVDDLLALGRADGVLAILVAVVAFFRTVDEAVTTVGPPLALRGTAAVRAVQDPVIAFLGPFIMPSPQWGA
jgi:hypothetical protein